MAFPGSREETATPANPVSSNTINAIQDAILDIYAGNIGTPLKARMYTPAAGRATGGTFPQIGTGVRQFHGNWAPAAAGDTLLVGLNLKDGEFVDHIEVQVIKDSSASFDVSFCEAQASGFGTIASATNVNSGTGVSGALATVTVTPGITAQAGRGYHMSIRAIGAITGGGVAPFQVCTITVYTSTPTPP